MEATGIRYGRPLSDILLGIHFEIDDVDVPSKTPSVTILDISFLAFSIIVHIVDMIIDINLAVRYLLGNKMKYFIWTTSFIFLSSLINVIISKRMQYQDQKINPGSDQREDYGMKVMIKKGLCCMIAVIFQLVPVIHYYDTLVYAWKSHQCKKLGDRNGQRKYYLKMLKEDQDVALLRVFECFLEAAPQQVLQLTILLKSQNSSINFEFVHQVSSIVTSFTSMGWAMASYHRSIRLAQKDKMNISITGSTLQFLWHFFITVSRILSLSIIASVYALYTGIYCLCHWIGMTIWIIIDSGCILEFCRDYRRPPHMSPLIRERIYSVLFASIIGVVHIFIYLNVVEGNTFVKYLTFYPLCFLENLIAGVLWAVFCNPEIKGEWYYPVVINLCIVPFLLGIIAMILYYTLFHPTVRNQHSQSVPFQQHQ